MKNLIPIIITFSIFSILTLATVAFQSLHDSPTPQLKPLTIGDQMPPISATISINAQANKETLKTSSDKLIILEFINTHCSISRESIPHLQQLQQTFKDDLTIILITKQRDSLVRSLSSNLSWSLPIITEDTTLSQLFPYLTVPHQVWIKKRKVVAITNWQYANEENVRKLIAGEKVKTNLKQEETFDLSKPLMANGIEPYYQSAIIPRINFGSGVHKNDNQFLVYNADIKELFKIAYGRPAFPSGAYIILDLHDSLKHLIKGPTARITGHYKKDSTYLTWRERYTYCYNLTYPEGTTILESELQENMQHDLNLFFRKELGITSSLQKRRIKCHALVTHHQGTSFQTSGGKRALSTSQEDYQIVNQPLSLLIGQIAYRHHDLGMPVINATGYSGNVDISFPGDLGDLSSVNKGLDKYGLQFIEQDHEIEVVVLQETPPTN